MKATTIVYLKKALAEAAQADEYDSVFEIAEIIKASHDACDHHKDADQLSDDQLSDKSVPLNKIDWAQLLLEQMIPSFADIKMKAFTSNQAIDWGRSYLGKQNEYENWKSRLGEGLAFLVQTKSLFKRPGDKYIYYLTKPEAEDRQPLPQVLEPEESWPAPSENGLACSGLFTRPFGS